MANQSGHAAIRNEDAPGGFWPSRAAYVGRPNVARIYDTLLGSQRWPAVDQQAVGELLRLIPDAVTAAYKNREFVLRAVRFLADHAGIRQFIDIGAGLPARAPVHELAQRSAPGARVLYVDNDPAVIAETGLLLADNSAAIAVHGDLRDPEGILRCPALRALIDPDQPVAILMAGVLHYIKDDEDSHRAVSTLKASVSPGSYLVISHATGDDTPPEIMSRVCSLYQGATAPLTPRSRAEVTRFLEDWKVLPPGVANGSAWRPGYAAAETRHTRFYAAMGRKP
jgi:O-methyltransferase involved in polyketide biosynthesis